MPLYDYRCEACQTEFEALVRSLDDRVACPQCGADQVRREMSVPAAAQIARNALPIAAAAPSGGCGRPQCAGGFCAGS